MKVIVTGGDGFIGSNLVNELLLRGDEVVVIDNCYDGVSRYGGCKSVDGLVTMIPEDIVNIQRCTSRVLAAFDGEPPDRMYHFAAHYANLRSVEEPVQCVMTNCVGTMAVLEFCAAFDINEMVYASSSIAAAEDGKPEIMTPYGITKWTAELLAVAHAEKTGMKLSCPRFFNVYGSGDHPGKYRAVVPNFFRMALRNEPITVTGENQARDFTYIGDVIKAVMAGADQLPAMAEGENIIYNIAKGRSDKITYLVEVIKDLAHSASFVQILPDRDWEGIQDRVGDVKTFRELFPEVADNMADLKTGLTESFQWYANACK